MLSRVASLLLMMSGCAHMGSEPRLRLASLKASWRAGASAVTPHLHDRDFWQGWRAGFYDAASGGTGLPPPVPPRRYWDVVGGPEIRQAKIDEWYRGFAEGVAEAGNQGWQDAYAIPGPSAACTDHSGCTSSAAGEVTKIKPSATPSHAFPESKAPIALTTHMVSEELYSDCEALPPSQPRWTPRVRRCLPAVDSSPGLLAAMREMYFEPNADCE